MGLSYTGSRCLFVTRVMGKSRLPVPPARTTPFMCSSFTLSQNPQLVCWPTDLGHELISTSKQYLQRGPLSPSRRLRVLQGPVPTTEMKLVGSSQMSFS